MAGRFFYFFSANRGIKKIYTLLYISFILNKKRKIKKYGIFAENTLFAVSLPRLFHVVIIIDIVLLFVRRGYPCRFFLLPVENAFSRRFRRFYVLDDKLYIRKIKTPYVENSGKITFGRKNVENFSC